MSKEAMKLALEALYRTESKLGGIAWEREAEAIIAIHEALAEQPAQQRHISYVCPQCYWSLEEQPAQQQEPVAWITKTGNVWKTKAYSTDIPLYASQPASKPWVGLTDEMVVAAARMLSDRQAAACNVDCGDMWKLHGNDFIEDARAALEAAHGIKENT